ncbi:MAG: transglutaminase-like domain-containing protein [Candidatus Sumerlaeaceae bacterium]
MGFFRQMRDGWARWSPSCSYDEPGALGRIREGPVMSASIRRKAEHSSVGILAVLFLLSPSIVNSLLWGAENPMTKQTQRAVPNGLPEYLVETQLGSELAHLEKEGSLREVECILTRLRDADATAPLMRCVSRELAEREIERLSRLRREFALTLDEFRKKLVVQIPDVTTAELEQWVREESLQCVRIDGELRVFRREPANLFRFSEKAQKRRSLVIVGKTTTPRLWGDPSDRPTQHFVLNRHLRELVHRCAATSQPRIFHLRVRATHRVTLQAGRVPPGTHLRCWLPFPRETETQHHISLIAAVPEPLLAAAPHAPQRTLYFEQCADADGKATFSAIYEFTTSAYLPLLADARPTKRLSTIELLPWLAEQPPHIVFSSDVRELAKQIVDKVTDPLARARRIFDWVVTNIRYASEMEYCVMPRIVEKVLVTRRGDCGVQALLFITLCRAAGIPARWVSGWVVYPSGWNMHDWAEFYAEPYGWLPADPSRGWRDDDDPRVREFFFGNVDAYRMVANHQACASFEPPKRFWRSDPVDNQRGELEWDGGNLYYDDWSYDVETITEQLD